MVTSFKQSASVEWVMLCSVCIILRQKTPTAATEYLSSCIMMILIGVVEKLKYAALSSCLGYFVCVRLFSCVISACMLYYCNMVRWAWLDWGLSGWLTTLLQCFDSAGWVIRPVKTVGCITYILLAQTLNHAQSINQSINPSSAKCCNEVTCGIAEVWGLLVRCAVDCCCVRSLMWS